MAQKIESSSKEARRYEQTRVSVDLEYAQIRKRSRRDDLGGLQARKRTFASRRDMKTSGQVERRVFNDAIDLLLLSTPIYPT